MEQKSSSGLPSGHGMAIRVAEAATGGRMLGEGQSVHLLRRACSCLCFSSVTSQANDRGQQRRRDCALPAVDRNPSPSHLPRRSREGREERGHRAAQLRDRGGQGAPGSPARHFSAAEGFASPSGSQEGRELPGRELAFTAHPLCAGTFLYCLLEAQWQDEAKPGPLHG